MPPRFVGASSAPSLCMACSCRPLARDTHLGAARCRQTERPAIEPQFLIDMTPGSTSTGKGATHASICSPMSGDNGVDASDPAQRGRVQELVTVGEMPVERSGPTHFTVALSVLYLDRRGRLKVRIHGRPRSDRKRSFLLSAVAPSTSTRHPRKARPINWAQRGGLASGRGNVS